MVISDGWSNRTDSDSGVAGSGTYTVFMKDGSNYPGITSYDQAKAKADLQIGSRVRDMVSAAIVYTSQ